VVAYGGFLTKQYDHNFVPWVSCLLSEECRGEFFFYPQHLLHLPAELAVLRICAMLGYTGGPIVPMQLAVAVLGATMAALFFLIVTEIVANLAVGGLATLGWLVSYGNWIVHTDGWYHPFGNVFVFLAAWCLLRSRGRATGLGESPAGRASRPAVALAACAFGLAFLFSQITLAYLPGLLLVILLDHSLRLSRPGLRDAAAFCALYGLVAILGYLAVGYTFLHFRAPEQFMSWVLYTHAGLPGWGALSWGRIDDIVIDTLGAFAPIRAGIGLRDLLHGQVHGAKLLAQAAVFAVPAFGCLTVAIAVRLRRRLWSKHKQAILLCLVWLAPLYAFGAWYEPQGFFLWLSTYSPWILVGLVLAEAVQWYTGRQLRLIQVASTLSLIILALGNFTGAIWPRHASTPVDYQKAAQAAALMTERDFLLSPTYSWWGAYLPLFPDRRSGSLVMMSAGKMSHGEIEALIRDTVEETHRRGGRLFFADAGQYSEEQWEWLIEYGGTPFYAEDFARLPKRLAWALLDGEIVWEIFPR
jgi:hypothetical protein